MHYIFTLLCLTSIVTMVSFDATTARKRCLCAQALDREENLFSMKKSLCADLKYKSQKTPAEKKEASSSRKEKTLQVKKKRRLRLLKVPFSRPPNNSRYNLYALLTEAPEKQKEDSSWHAIFLRLLTILYVDTGYIAKDAPKQLVSALLAQKDHILARAEQDGEEVLATLTLPEAEGRILYNLLRGTPKIPSLLHFVHYEKQQAPKVNLLFASPEFLQAILVHPEAYQDILSLREQILSMAQHQEQEIQQQGQAAALDLFRTRTDFRMELRDRTQILLSQYNLLPILNKKIFDYTLGTEGNYFFLTDPETGIVHRCRCPLATPSSPQASS